MEKDIIETYSQLQVEYLLQETKRQEYLAQAFKGWVIDGNKAIYDTQGYKIEISIETNSNGFKNLIVDVENDKTTPHGSYTTADIPLEILYAIMN